MAQHFYFDIWPSTDYVGAALGELTEATERTVREADQSIGSGSFQINRHSDQAAWCEPRALVRVRLVPGGPFAYDDPRYVAAFFIETSEDVALSEDEEGGEELTRGGPSLISWLKRTIIYPNANITGHRSYWRFAKTLGVVQFPAKTSGEAFRTLVLNSMQRAGVLDGLTLDFTLTDDSSGTPWPDSDTTWKFPVGMNLLEVLSKVVSSKVYYRIKPSLLLSVYEDHPGADLSGSVVFSKGVDLSEASSKTIDASNFFSRALVRGDVDSNELKFLQVFDTGVEAETGRVEGYVEYKSTPTTARLQRAGEQAIAKAKLQQDGPVTSGVISDFVPFVDYEPGDLVTVDIPEVYDSAEVRIAAITLKEIENGEYDVIHEYQAVPFDPASGPDNFASASDVPPGGPGGGPRGCNDCPEPTPFVPPTDGGTVADGVLHIGSAAFVGDPVDREFHYGSDIGITAPTLVVGQQYRLVVDVIASGAPGSPYVPNDLQAGLGVNIYNPDGSTTAAANPPNTNSGWSGGGGVDETGPPQVDYAFGIGYTVQTNYGTGLHYEGQWVEFTGPGTTETADIAIHATPLSGYWGFDVVARVRLETRNGDTTPIVGEGADAPFVGQEVNELASDAPVSEVYTTNFPYAAGSLKVYVAGVRVAVTEVDPATGQWSFSPTTFDPGSATITVTYQAASSTATGATNAYPTPGSSTIPPSLLPSVEDDKWKQPVRVATTASVTISTALNAGDSIDGVTLAEGDRVLVRAQSTGSQNGIYLVGATPSRTSDFDEDDEVLGSLVYVVAGSTLGGKVYRVTNLTAPDVGTDAISFAEFAPTTATDWAETGDITTLDYGDTPDAGVLDEVARGDHRHGMPDAPTVDPADDTSVWMPLTTVVGGEPELVWDGDDSLIPTLTPLS